MWEKCGNDPGVSAKIPTFIRTSANHSNPLTSPEDELGARHHASKLVYPVSSETTWDEHSLRELALVESGPKR